MANFNTTVNLEPDFGVTKTSKPLRRVIRYADGYEHRLTFGIPNHQNPKVYSLTYENITEYESDVLENFLDARALDNASFDFTPPNDIQGKYVCDNWTKRIPFPSRATINVTFRQVFEPS
jgi:phage-related protein|tara:strand:- start:433 stop:792 length:360 start_codon:yes stop_codon:yes gene_type:complete